MRSCGVPRRLGVMRRSRDSVSRHVATGGHRVDPARMSRLCAEAELAPRIEHRDVRSAPSLASSSPGQHPYKAPPQRPHNKPRSADSFHRLQSHLATCTALFCRFRRPQVFQAAVSTCTRDLHRLNLQSTWQKYAPVIAVHSQTTHMSLYAYKIYMMPSDCRLQRPQR